MLHLAAHDVAPDLTHWAGLVLKLSQAWRSAAVHAGGISARPDSVIKISHGPSVPQLVCVSLSIRQSSAFGFAAWIAP